MIVQSNGVARTVVQCDFDGTITEKDVSFLLLDTFADGDWRQMLKEYQEGRISVGLFNTRAFAMVKADRQTLVDFVLKSDEVKVRPGFGELLTYCSGRGFEFIIVSNGVDFYIEALLRGRGIKDIPVFAARSRFRPGGMEVRYIGPDGRQVEDSFKEAYAQRYLGKGYRVVYVGNGVSDFYPARRAHHVFATGDLLGRCQEMELSCTPFDDLNDVVRGLHLLPDG